MPAEFIALLDKPWLLATLLAVGAFCGMLAERIGENINKAERKAYWQRRRNRGVKFTPREAPRPADRNAFAADQLREVMSATFTARPLLNNSERRLLAVLEATLAEERPEWRVMGQVSLGEILASTNPSAYAAVNSKRVDFLIVDASCAPLHAIEFQGTGHHLGTETAARDAVKKEALRRAGIGYIEVMAGDTPATLRDIVRKLSTRPGAG